MSYSAIELVDENLIFLDYGNITRNKKHIE
jgi:hypothetical protein